jgi:hypothetical protein
MKLVAVISPILNAVSFVSLIVSWYNKKRKAAPWLNKAPRHGHAEGNWAQHHKFSTSALNGGEW